MKKNIKLLMILFAIFFATMICCHKVEAASATITENRTVTVGTPVTVSATVNAGAWSLNLSGVGQSRSLVGQTSSVGNETASTSITFTPTQAGEYTFSLTGDMTDFSADAAETVSRNCVIVAKNNETPSTGGGATTGSSDGNNTSNNDNADTGNTTTQKSSNANLSNLGIRPNDFTGFKPGTTTYQVEVPENVTEIEVYATAQNAKASISGTGKKSLNVGANAFNVVVTAEDGTKKTYTINVTRQGEVEEENPEDTTSEEEEIEQAKGLAELKIDNLSLSPSFETGVYEYQVKYIGQDTELNITTKATQEDYVVEVTGNEDLKEGENIITILVSDKDGNNVATYQVTVNKSLVDEEAIAREEAKKQEEFRKTVIIGSIIAVVVIAIIVFLIIRHKRNQRFAEEYSGVPFSGLNEDEDWQNSNQGWENEEQQEIQEEEIEQDKSTLDNLSQEELKNRYLDNYNKDSLKEDFYEEEKPRRARHKGKRFK